MISYSIFQLKESDLRRKAAQNIILTGGVSRTPSLAEMVEDSLVERICLFDPSVENVEIKSIKEKKLDTANLSWVGATIVPKLDCMVNMFVS